MRRQRWVVTPGHRLLGLTAAMSVVALLMPRLGNTQESFALRWVPLPAGIGAQRATEVENAAKAILTPQTSTENGKAFLLGREMLGVYSRRQDYERIVEIVQKLAQLNETRIYELTSESLWEATERVLLSNQVPDWDHQGTHFLVRGPVSAVASAEAMLLQSGYIRDPSVPVCERVQLYYVRKPAAVGAMLNSLAPALAPEVKVGAATADDTVPFLMLSGPVHQVYQLRRMVAEIDRPLPQVTFDIWAVQVSGRDRKDVARRVEEVRKDIKRIQLACDERQRAVRSDLAKKLAEALQKADRADEYRELGVTPLAAALLANPSTTGAATLEQLTGQRTSDWAGALEAYRADAARGPGLLGGADLDTWRETQNRAQRSLNEISAAATGRLRAEVVDPAMKALEAGAGPRRTSGLGCVTHTTVTGLSGCAMTLTGAAVSYVESTKLGKLDSTAAGTATSPGTADALAARLGALLGGSPTSVAMGSLGLAMAASQEAQTWEALNDGAQVTLTPTVMLNGRTAEVNIKLTVTHNDPGTAVPAQATSWPQARVGKHEVSTVRYAESLVPLELSSLEIQTTQPRSPNVVPFLGQIPLIGQLFRLRKAPVTMYHESLLLILPTVGSPVPETMRQLKAAGLVN